MKYGMLGCGKMGGSIVRGLCKITKDICVSDRSGKAAELAQELGIEYGNNLRIARECDRIFLGVKPNGLAGLLEELKALLQERKPLLISMAAGVEIEAIQRMVGAGIPVIRIMPNTPTAVGKGVIQYCYNEQAERFLKSWLQDMAFCGLLDPLEEKCIDAASALSGSGPAYLYVMLEAMADGGVACGLPREKALEYAAMTMAGAAEMYLQTKQHPGALKDAVCSPGGSTIEGIHRLEQNGFRGAVMDCITAAYKKNKELGK
jgi:pyrroline-5-carboxylate reductase